MVDFTVGGTSGHPSPTGRAVPYVVEVEVDATESSMAVGTHSVINVPAGTLVLFAGIEVTDATAGSGTVILGDGGNDDRYVEVQAPTATGYLTSQVVSYFYGSADTIDIKVATATINDAVFRVFAVMVDVS